MLITVILKMCFLIENHGTYNNIFQDSMDYQINSFKDNPHGHTYNITDKHQHKEFCQTRHVTQLPVTAFEHLKKPNPDFLIKVNQLYHECKASNEGWTSERVCTVYELRYYHGLFTTWDSLSSCPSGLHTLLIVDNMRGVVFSSKCVIVSLLQ